MGETTNVEPPKILVADEIITKDEHGKSVVSLIRNGKVLPANPNSSVSQSTDENGSLRVVTNAGRKIRGELRQSGASQAELQANFKPFFPQKITKK